MNRFAALGLAAAVAAIATVWQQYQSSAITPTPTALSGIVFGFVPDYRFDSFDFQFAAERCTHLCLFGSEANGDTGELVLRLPSADKLDLIQQNTQLYLGLGGDGRSAFFSKLCANKLSMDRFVRELKEAVAVHRLHGIELNWQYPGTPQDFSCLAKLVADIKTGSSTGTKVSMSLPPNVDFARYAAAVRLNLDLAHVMLYQLGVGGGTTNKVRDVAAPMAKLFARSSPGTKLTLGLPFYTSLGRSHEQRLVSEQQQRGEEFESGELLRTKRAQAAKYGLSGVAVWELGQDCRVSQQQQHAATCRSLSDSLLYQLTK